MNELEFAIWYLISGAATVLIFLIIVAYYSYKRKELRDEIMKEFRTKIKK